MRARSAGLLAFIALTSASAQSTNRSMRADSARVTRVADVDVPYTTPALRALVAFCARVGADTPASLRGYRARVESEIALLLRTGDDNNATERVLQVEQVQSDIDWRSSGTLEQRVVGHRMQAATASLSALTYFQRPWLVPSLYGNRLPIVLGRGTARDGNAREPSAITSPPTASRDQLAPDVPTLAVHPFASDRDAVYTFAGGDTVAVLQAGAHAVTVVRVLVTPVVEASSRTLLFRGEIDVDVERGQIVRMRGQFVVAAPHRSLLRRVITSSVETVAFAELENAEFDGRFWLPTFQRLEGQARSPLAANVRPIVRVVSHYHDYSIDAAPIAALRAAASDAASDAKSDAASEAAVDRTARLTFAPRDTLSGFSAWRLEIGRATGSVAKATDFDDVAPDSWRPNGAPRLDWRAERVNDVFRYNRVEGAFIGVAGALHLRDVAPGTTIGANAGVAWAEETVRGALWARTTRAGWTYDTRFERALANTNDFRPLLDFEQSLSAMLVSADDYDYVDRHAFTLGITRQLPIVGKPTWHAEVGPASDRAEFTRIPSGIVHGDSTFRVNRPVTAGRYTRLASSLQLHPNVSGDFLEPGIGAGLWYEHGAGQLQWDRVESRVTARHTRGAFSYAGRIDAVALFTRQLLPQQLVEFGENEGLPGYAYKEFGGDRAVLAHAGMLYQFPWLRAPLRFVGPRHANVLLPGIAPALALGVQTGWAGASSPTTRAALALFGTRTDTLTGLPMLATRPTDGARSTINVSLRLFGGTLGLGVARPIDRVSRDQRWRFVFGVGQPF